MSEFSCSYHLKSESIHDCVSLIKKANVVGFLFPSKNGWVSFVVDEPDFEFSKKLIDVNDGILLNFINAEDHGWSFEIYNKNNKVCKFECNYDNGESYAYEKFADNWDSLFDNNQSEILGRIFTVDKEEPLKNNANDFASSMGLYFYEWLSYEYICHDPALHEEYEGYKIIKIKKKNDYKKKKTPVLKVPVFQWTAGCPPLPINREIEYEEKDKRDKICSPKNILYVGETFFACMEFVNVGRTCIGITINITGKSLDDENIDFEKVQLFYCYPFEGTNPLVEAEFRKVDFQDGRKGYSVTLETAEIVHSISKSESSEIFRKTQSISKKFHQYHIRAFAKAVSIPNKIEMFMFVHPNDNYFEGNFYEPLFNECIVFKK